MAGGCTNTARFLSISGMYPAEIVLLEIGHQLDPKVTWEIDIDNEQRTPLDGSGKVRATDPASLRRGGPAEADFGRVEERQPPQHPLPLCSVDQPTRQQGHVALARSHRRIRRRPTRHHTVPRRTPRHRTAAEGIPIPAIHKNTVHARWRRLGASREAGKECARRSSRSLSSSPKPNWKAPPNSSARRSTVNLLIDWRAFALSGVERNKRIAPYSGPPADGAAVLQHLAREAGNATLVEYRNRSQRHSSRAGPRRPGPLPSRSLVQQHGV